MKRRRFLEIAAAAAGSGLVPASFASVARVQVTNLALIMKDGVIYKNTLQ
ncbi:hypothetical protein SuNHUV7_09080 (plasmid) [Pseudoseohaeicola sp. NH-UV-7]